MPNPFLPLDTCIADGEPHVFGDRVYLFGSHDKAGGDTYCMLDYEFWSAPADDLSQWSCKGVSYRASQDPQYGDKFKYMYAPDVVQGNDGKFYLYYCMAGHKGSGGYGRPISVAVCDTPDGEYEYCGFVRNSDGSPMLKYVTFDPAVINDGGTIRLYYGSWYPFHEQCKFLGGFFRMAESKIFGKSLREIRECRDGIMGANHVELADDMLTVKGEPRHIMPTNVAGTSFEAHPFFEGSSIRRIGDTYYFIYSSVHGHELCYATSKNPDRDFTYGGTVVSGGDIGYNGRSRKDRLNATGTNHGSIVQIGGEWYVFYHRNTNRTAYSRQACAEPIAILPDGSIPQVEVTSVGLDRKPLEANRTYPAAICCNLTNEKMPHKGNGIIRKNIPFICFDGNEAIVTAIKNTQIGYKYFNFSGSESAVTVRAEFDGEWSIDVLTDDAKLCGSAVFNGVGAWRELTIPVQFPAGTHSLDLRCKGKGQLRLSHISVQTLHK